MYYLLETDYFAHPIPYRTQVIQPQPEYTPSKWLLGRIMSAPPSPLQINLWERGGSGMAEMFLDSIPLFRKDFVAAMMECGIDNVQTFPATLTSPEGQFPDAYYAVNILGLVKCADLEKSVYEDITGTGIIAMSFRELIIDSRAASGGMFFRLAEAVASIVAHESVRAHMEQKGFKHLCWRLLA